MTLSQRKKQAIQDLVAVVVSIVVAVFIVRSGVVHTIVSHFGDGSYIGSFFAGILFTSIFTIAPAVAVLGELAQNHSIVGVAFWGGVGAVVGDYILFTLVRDRFAQDIKFLMGTMKIKRMPAIFSTKLMHYLIPLTGALIVASPFPDEIGLAMLGVSKMNEQVFIFLAFFLNAAGIFAVAWFAQTVMW